MTGNRDRLERQLVAAVSSSETDCVITVHLTEEGNRSGLKRQQVQRLADLIAQTADRLGVAWTGAELWEVDAKLADYVSALSVQRLPGYGKVDVIIPLTQYTRPDARWIEEGIALKERKYGRQTIKDVTLVIGALGLVTPDQIASFGETHKPEELPFTSICVVSPFDGVFWLKRRDG